MGPVPPAPYLLIESTSLCIHRAPRNAGLKHRHCNTNERRQGSAAVDDLLQEFITETMESLAQLDSDMVEFERDPTAAETLSRIFRVMHTIKGTCGFLGLPRLERVAHAGEDVLGKFRDGALAVTPGAVSSILRCV